MEFYGKKIGYWPYRHDMKAAGDRRRFVFYANEKDLNYELASWKNKYDIVYLTVGCNVDQWIKYKKNNPEVKLVYEIVDSYFLENITFFSLLRGITKFIKGKESRLYFDYRKAILKMVKAADAIVCSTPVQQEFLLKYNKNVHVSLDYFLDDITHFKTDYQTSGKLKVVWEGQAYTVHNLLYLNSVLKTLSFDIELHIITDPDIIYPFKIFNKKTASLLSAIPCDHYFHEWKRDTFSEIIAEMDLAVIPFEKDNVHGRLTFNKPENKLLLLWQIGVPVITTNSPAYQQVMNTAGLPLYCSNLADWERKITDFIELNAEQKKDLMQKASGYLNTYHTKEIILSKWDKVFESVT